ncbi:pIIIa [Tree shrew adenovirus 1]|uniref:Pre-hexon-linking protein IIIa n=1 Tax=Tree shrew adenovirus serotype 1 TaxID=47680 RepID=A0A2U9AG83_ADET1|nr:pIIIa [Tree shrew adenovirus 1]
MSAANNPVVRANLQSQSAVDDNWAAALRRILALTARNPSAFANQPRANRFDAILEAVVPSRKDPTHEKVLAIVNALAETGAIHRGEGGQIYNALLERVSKYNSLNVQTNLDRLVGDVREAVAQKERGTSADGLGSLVAFNAFVATQPATLERGQDDYLAFISAMRMMVSEVPQSFVYRTGPFFYFQTSRNGSQTVNLSRAFDTLRPLWGVKASANEGSASSLLTPNARLLLLLVAPFTDSATISRDTYLGHLLTLYREAIGRTHIDEQTYGEITSVSQALGYDTADMQATLNYLLTNRTKKLPQQYRLSESEERILRYLQQSVSLYLMREGATASTALDMASANMEPSFYSANRPFINRLMDYFHRAAALAPDYFTNAILNPHWLPPEGFFTGNFDFPDATEGLLWDDSDSAFLEKPKSLGDSRGLSSLQPRSRTFSWSSEDGAAAPAPVPRGSPRGSRGSLELDTSLLGDDKVKNVPLPNNAVQGLIDQMSRWKTYREEQLGARPKRRRQELAPPESEEDEDDKDNIFSYLRPKGLKRL